MRFIFITLDGNHGAALRLAADMLKREGVQFELALYNATTLHDPAELARLEADIARADLVWGAMLFGEEYVRPLEPILAAAACPVCVITSNPTLIRCTRIGKFALRRNQEPGLLARWARKFRPRGGEGEGRRQLAMLRNLGSIMQHIPGKARDLHSYIAVHDYWLNPSPLNLRHMLALLIERYVPGWKGKLAQHPPLRYPDTAIYHPDAPEPLADFVRYAEWRTILNSQFPNGSVGILSLRTVILSGNTAPLDALVRALEARGVEARVAYSAGLDLRPAMEQFFTVPVADAGRRSKVGGRKSSCNGPSTFDLRPSTIDVLVNGAGFSLVGGMAESRPDEARTALEGLDVGYLDLIPLAFQRVEEWRRDDTGLSPIQIAMNLAIPELDGAAEPIVYGGPSMDSDRFVALPAQVELAAERIARRARLRRTAKANKRVAVVLFNFPPNLGNAGTAAYLDVFQSLHRLLLRLQGEGYRVDVPLSPEELRQLVVDGNALQYGTDGNVAARLPLNEYRRLFPDYTRIEPFWGYAPGELLNDGKAFHILGAQLGNVFVGLQPSFGYERDPMRLLMAKDAAPHHGFAAFYTWIEHVWGADVVLHFGTHGALEFMPGKQAGLSADCWPSLLIGGLPNFYYYSVNNPSEATIAKRRGAATLVSYMVPPLQQAGLYKGLRLLKDSIDSYRAKPSPELLDDIRAQAEKLGLGGDTGDTGDAGNTGEGELPVGRGSGGVPQHFSPPFSRMAGELATRNSKLNDDIYIASLSHELIEVEQRMIPLGLHVLGSPPAAEELVDVLALVAAFTRPAPGAPTLPELVARELGHDYALLRDRLQHDAHAQDAWREVDQRCRQALRDFVEWRMENAERTGWQSQPEWRMENAELRNDSTTNGHHNASNADPSLSFSILHSPFSIQLGELLDRMLEEREMDGLLRALEGGYIAPSPGNDVVRNPLVVPTGRNIHGLDPFRVPTAAAQEAGERLVRELLERLTAEQGSMPETVAMVLWGTDNLKSDGEGVAQALALLGARVVLDELGKVSDVELLPLSVLGRPRVDVVVTVSGIFRDLLSHQMALIDRAVRLAAIAEEPPELNFVRRHALEQAGELGVGVGQAATRVFANAPGSYGANVNHLVESSSWDDEGQLAEAFMTRKCFAYGPRGQWLEARPIMERALATVDATFQNIDSFELGISDIDHYYENLGGVTKSVELLRGSRPPVMVADAVSTTGRLSSLEQMVRLESRAKLLNPKWFEAMLAHGYEGVREIETRVGNTFGWSATAGAVDGWVYQGVAETFVLDEAMRERLGQLNPHATAALARRLLEAHGRGFWDADEATIEALQQAYGDLEDRLEGVERELEA